MTGIVPISTPLGSVSFGITIDHLPLDLAATCHAYSLPNTGQLLHWSTPSGQIEAIRCRPALLQNDWDAITDCWAILWRMYVTVPLAHLQFSSVWHPTSPTYTGGPSSGENQESQTWDDSMWMLSLGTEGEDGLYQRAAHNDGLPSHLLDTAPPGWDILPIVSYDTHGLRLDLPILAAGELIQAQFVIAWAAYDAESISTWKVMDLSAHHILAGAGDVPL